MPNEPNAAPPPELAKLTCWHWVAAAHGQGDPWPALWVPEDGWKAGVRTEVPVRYVEPCLSPQQMRDAEKRAWERARDDAVDAVVRVRKQNADPNRPKMGPRQALDACMTDIAEMQVPAQPAAPRPTKPRDVIVG